MSRVLRCFVVLGEESGRVIEIRTGWHGHWRAGREYAAMLPSDLTVDALASLIREAMAAWTVSEVVELVWCLPPDILGVAFRAGESDSQTEFSIPFQGGQPIARQILRAPIGSTWLWMHDSWSTLLTQVGNELNVSVVYQLPRAVFLTWFTRHRWTLDTGLSTAASRASVPFVLVDGAYTHVFLESEVLIRSYSADLAEDPAERLRRLYLESGSIWPKQTDLPFVWNVALEPRNALPWSDPRGTVSPAVAYRSWLSGPSPVPRLRRWLHAVAIMGMVVVVMLLAGGGWQYQQWVEETRDMRSQLKAALPEANSVASLKQQVEGIMNAMQADQQATSNGRDVLVAFAQVITNLPAGWTISDVQLGFEEWLVQVHASSAAQLPAKIIPASKANVEWTRQSEPIQLSDTKHYQATYAVSAVEQGKP